MITVTIFGLAAIADDGSAMNRAVAKNKKRVALQSHLVFRSDAAKRKTLNLLYRFSFSFLY